MKNTLSYSRVFNGIKALVGVILVIVVSRNAFSREIKNNLKPSEAEPENSCRAARVAPCAPLDRFLLSFFSRLFVSTIVSLQNIHVKLCSTNSDARRHLGVSVFLFEQKRTRDLIERNGYRRGTRRDSIGNRERVHGGLGL